jgi:hypothetical protein
MDLFVSTVVGNAPNLSRGEPPTRALTDAYDARSFWAMRTYAVALGFHAVAEPERGC